MSMWSGISISEPFYTKIESAIQQSYPNSCILYIDELQNQPLKEKYDKKKLELESKRGAENISELLLFHGTKAENINSIAENGFLTRLNQRAAFGNGIYFSTLANYSKDYTDSDTDEISYMFMCNVLIGKCHTCHGQIDTNLYDNSVNTIKNPTIYVSPYDDGCFPRYLIAFYKNTK